ncbi:hypothetical protein [Muriicola soli]|uniref:Adenylate kinase n=1 Tax=Muriicola soli TaxID=2507538 RepID=A0A411E8H7_9FLAO|nr:hypothetical protein [Muriicola soli]QBA64021.1 hypothetical protein EQY75_05395 [Muriicola soli]
MLYIISGASRSGKTIIAKKLSAQLGIPYLSLDWIMMGFTNGLPEFGVHDKLFPDEIAERLWNFIKAMLESMIYTDTDCVIEGEALLPELIIELLQKHPDNVKVCFLGYSEVEIDRKVNEIKKFSQLKSDWLTDKSDAYIEDHVKNMIAHSKLIKRSCTENQLKYIDTSSSFSDAIDVTMKYLSV